MSIRLKLFYTKKMLALCGAGKSRRLILQRLSALVGLTSIGGPSVLLGGCGDGGGGSSSMPPGSTPPILPSLGAHNLAFNPLGISKNPISTAPMATQASGSTVLACVGRGANANQTLPTDNKGNTAVQLGTSHTYSRWTNSGTALYAIASAVGGSGHLVSVDNTTTPTDEVTLAVVEVLNGGVIKDVQWTGVLAPNALTSPTVTTTGPATLVAFWWGDDGVGPVTAVPDGGFTPIDFQLISFNAVECVVATKDVVAAGTYNVTWTATPSQGAQMWLVAVQKAP